MAKDKTVATRSSSRIPSVRSHLFPGHENRMKSHIHQVWNHRCERIGRSPCIDCIYLRNEMERPG